MSVRVGHIDRHEDVHGVSGTGKVAEVFEASNGKCVVIWVSPNPSVNVYDNVKAVENNHRHGGKTDVVWDWEQEPDPDPMDKILEAKKPELSKEEVAEIAEEAGEVASEMARAKTAEKIAEKVAEQRVEANLEDLEEEPEAEEAPVEDDSEEKKKTPRKKKTTGRKAPTGKEKK